MEELRIICTCEACPEQYDVYFGGIQYAYIRLRFGKLEVYAPDASGETIYFLQWVNDPLKGCFEGDEKRTLMPEILETIHDVYESLNLGRELHTQPLSYNAEGLRCR